MKAIAIVFLAISCFVSGMCIQGVRDHQGDVETVTNPFGPPTKEQQEIMDKIKWRNFDQFQEEHQADVQEGMQR